MCWGLCLFVVAAVFVIVSGGGSSCCGFALAVALANTVEVLHFTLPLTVRIVVVVFIALGWLFVAFFVLLTTDLWWFAFLEWLP